MVAPHPAAAHAARPLLLVGFDAFGGQTDNPSAALLQALHGEAVDGHTIDTLLLPTVFGTASAALHRRVLHAPPALVLCTGLAGGRAALSLERVAINVDDARIPDNAGAQPIDQPVVPGGPAAYFSTLPIKAMRAAIADAGLPAEVSQTAGTFVCNHVFYGLMHLLATQPALAGVRGGFMHLPWLPGQGAPSLDTAATARGVRAALRCALAWRADAHEAGGALH